MSQRGLSAVSTGLTGTLDAPRFTFKTQHPYATGFQLSNGTETETAQDEWALDLTAGQHDLTVSVTTAFGPLAPQPLAYVVRPRHDGARSAGQ